MLLVSALRRCTSTSLTAPPACQLRVLVLTLPVSRVPPGSGTGSGQMRRYDFHRARYSRVARVPPSTRMLT